MAIAPVNKFISLAVPVAPGMQELYEVPTGTSALLLYAQVAHVGAGNTYPTVTFIQRRESRSTGNTRDIKVIEDVEIPPNDAVIIVDGRMVLEKTPLVLDKIFIKGTQQNVGIITNVTYHEPSGIATVTTAAAHNLNAGDPICLSGISFSCTGSTGITTTIFPDPQQSFIIDSIQGTVGTSKTFTAEVGVSKGYPHIYQPAIHYFERCKPNAVEVMVSSTVTVGTKYLPSNASYNPTSGEMTITLPSMNLQNNDKVKLADNSFIFTCSMDNRATEHSYPRSTDPASGQNLNVARVNATTIRVNVGQSMNGGFVAPLQMEFVGSILENSTT